MINPTSLLIRVNCAGETTPSRFWHWKSDSMPGHDLVIVRQGKATYTDGQNSWQVSPGSCMLFRQGKSYSGIQDPDSPVAMLFIHFDFLDSKKRVSTPCPSNLLPVHFRIERLDFVASLARNVLEAKRLADTGNNSGQADESAQLWLRALWAELQHQIRQPRWQGFEREQVRQVEAVCRQIRERIGDPWRLSDIARALHCCPEHAGRLFRKYKGLSPIKFVIRTRIEAAQALLDSSSQSITEIAQTLGFCDVYAFSRQFRQHTGFSPRAFRHQPSNRS